MEKEINPPKDYIPFEELILCSNNFVNGLMPIVVDGNIPLLIGKGELPLVWLATPLQFRLRWKYIVVGNKSLSTHIKVIISKEDKEIIVIFVKENNKETILLKVKKESDGKAIVTEIDLRPLGLNIHGNNVQLFVGTNTLSKNTFQNVRTMIAIGSKQ
jgi:hypothetical protein